jgi:cell division septal protein FtsQ
MREKGTIILALIFILVLVVLGIYFVYQVYLEESNTNYRSITGQEVPSETTEILVQ